MKTMQEVFVREKIPKKYKKFKIGDFKSWDSLGNFNLLIAIEEKFNVKFTLEEMSKIENTDQIIKILKNDLKSK